MESVKVKRDSWHYWFITKMFPMSHVKTDICSYTRQLLGAFCLAGLVLIAASLALTLIIAGIVGWVQLWIHGRPFNPPVGIGAAMVLDALIVVVVTLIVGGGQVLAYAGDFLDYLDDRRRKPSKPGFIRTAYKHFKEKTCVKIEFS